MLYPKPAQQMSFDWPGRSAGRPIYIESFIESFEVRRSRTLMKWVVWISILGSLLTRSTKLSAQSPGNPSRTTAPDEALRAGDVVRLRIWREPDLSGDYQVDEESVVVLPKVGPVSVAGMSRDSLRQALLTSYREYLVNPSIDVVLLRRVNILGSVRNPGLYPVDPTMTVSDALGLAGGITSEAKRDRVELSRGGERVLMDLSPEARIGETPLRSGDQLYVPRRSWISRNPGLRIGGVTAVAGLVIRIALH
jgi:polysaccharide export outer membrane protein